MDPPRGRSWDLQIGSQNRQTVEILTLSGRISARTSSHLHRALDALSHATTVVVDLTAVDYISGPGITVLREAATVRTGRLALFGPTDPVRITLDLAGLSSLVCPEAALSQVVARFLSVQTDAAPRVADEAPSDR